MAKAEKLVKPAAPDRLTMNLFAPGMTALHRAGLGGLACTLRYIEKAYRDGALSDDDVPGGPWNDSPPWTFDDRAVELRFGEAKLARPYLERLFAVAFPIKAGLISTPGVYPGLTPPLAVRAELQNGLTLTFLQHGKTRNLEKTPTHVEIDPAGDGQSFVRVEYKRCHWFKHQDGWQELTDEKTGVLTKKRIEVIGPLNPGAVVRHVAFAAATRIDDRPDFLLPLYFAIVGCLPLPVNRGVGVLVIPDVEDLRAFVRDRPAMTPTAARDCRIAGTSDAVLQTVTRLRGRGYVEAGFLPSCVGARFQPTSWASQQKSRVDTSETTLADVARCEPSDKSGDARRLDQFATALALLPPRVVPKTMRETAGRGRATHVRERTESYWIDSIVRPLVAENLAVGRDWFDGFSRLMTEKGSRNAVRYEREGLYAMTNHMRENGYEREAALVRAIHQAISFTRREIKRKTQPGDPNGSATTATLNRQDRYMERIRLELANAKNATQAHEAICKLFRPMPYDNGLQQGAWLQLLPLLTDDHEWKRARNLAFLALASWGGRNAAEVSNAGATADGREDEGSEATTSNVED